jgi:hypothetical protein
LTLIAAVCRPTVAGATSAYGWSLTLLDVIYVVGILALVALVALVGKAVEKL